MTIRCQNLESLLHFVDQLSGPKIGFWGDEHFIFIGEEPPHSYQLDDVIHLDDVVSCLTLLREDSKKFELAAKIASQVEILTDSAEKALAKRNFFTRTFAAIRRAFRNLFINHERALDSLLNRIEEKKHLGGSREKAQEPRVRKLKPITLEKLEEEFRMESIKKTDSFSGEDVAPLHRIKKPSVHFCVEARVIVFDGEKAAEKKEGLKRDYFQDMDLILKISEENKAAKRKREKGPARQYVEKMHAVFHGVSYRSIDLHRKIR
ncbi:MAG: hypothetical protein KR126chlam1_01159 [Chlamydiae bacterium]|nr:hypothetical protein [Chlamydiota bacterium]